MCSFLYGFHTTVQYSRFERIIATCAIDFLAIDFLAADSEVASQEKVSEYDQEVPQSQTADQPWKHSILLDGLLHYPVI